MFKDKPELLNEPCVKNLINFMIIKHKAQNEAVTKMSLQETELMSACMNSEFMIKGGYSCRDAVEKMMVIFEKYI